MNIKSEIINKEDIEDFVLLKEMLKIDTSKSVSVEKTLKKLRF